MKFARGSPAALVAVLAVAACIVPAAFARGLLQAEPASSPAPSALQAAVQNILTNNNNFLPFGGAFLGRLPGTSSNTSSTAAAAPTTTSTTTSTATAADGAAAIAAAVPKLPTGGEIVGAAARNIFKGITARPGAASAARDATDPEARQATTVQTGGPDLKLELQVEPELTIGPALGVKPLVFSPSYETGLTPLDLALKGSGTVSGAFEPAASSTVSVAAADGKPAGFINKIG